jgi:hypothetical protein
MSHKTLYRCLGQLYAAITSPVSAENVTNSYSNGVSENYVLDSLSTVLLFHLGAMSATQRLTASLVVSEWAVRQPTNCKCPKSVIQRLQDCLSDIVCYDEVSLLYANMQTECQNFLAGLNQFNVDVTDTIPSG